MKRMGWLAALGLVAVVNGVVLAGVAWNRAGEPDAVLELTERELRLAIGHMPKGEDSGVAFSLVYPLGSYALPWFDEDKLRRVGFEPERYSGDGAAERRKHPQSRRAYVVLEYDGPAWAEWVARQRARVAELAVEISTGETRDSDALQWARDELVRLQRDSSRLVPVDVGLDPAVLRAEYGDRSRYAIVAAEVGMNVRGSAARDGGDASRPEGYIKQILVQRIHVPVEFHDELARAMEGDDGGGAAGTGGLFGGVAPWYEGAPRYGVRLEFGRRYEPWVVGVR